MEPKYKINLLNLLWLVPLIVGIFAFTGWMIWVFLQLH